MEAQREPERLRRKSAALRRYNASPSTTVESGAGLHYGLTAAVADGPSDAIHLALAERNHRQAIAAWCFALQ